MSRVRIASERCRWPPSISVVLRTQLGTGVSSATMAAAITTLHVSGVRSSSVPEIRPLQIQTPALHCPKADTAKKQMPSARPSVPKANRHTGSPMLPEFEKTSGAKPATDDHGLTLIQLDA